ncbi:TATA box binding protein associated factor-domain-containing protein [Hysterangium stoloniferum]|nr:TATA box binding protein associated factor-domain-containing protein [Hysterangium stoloniferum]
MNGKQKAQMQTGIYKPESIKDIAESLGINNLSDHVASALASDVEYRIHQVVEEASRFMRHARRTTLMPSDIDHALRVLNIEPLYGHSPAHPPRFRKVLVPSSGPVYFVEDEELDFDKVLKEEKIFLPKGVSWTAHWLAVEGVQPLIPENPPSIPRSDETAEQQIVNGQTQNGAGGSQFPPTPPSPSRPTPQSVKRTSNKQSLVKHVLSRELQLYYNRLTGSLIPPPTDQAKRSAALASLRIDAGLQSLLPYLVRWVAEGVVNSLKAGLSTEAEGRTLEVWLEVLGALLENSNFFIEPYLHQILPPLLSILLTATLPPSHSTPLRTLAAQTLSRLLTAHSTTYPSLSPRLMKTLLLALISPGKSKGTREGAVRGLMGVGKEATRKGLVESGGVKVVGDEIDSEAGNESLVTAVFDALISLRMPAADEPIPLDAESEVDKPIVEGLRETFGDFFARRMMNDGEWAKAILSGPGG